MPGGPRKPSAKKTSRRTSASRPRSPTSRGPRSARKREAHAEALADLADVAATQGLRWYVFGAQAVNLLGYPRATADLDVTFELASEDTGRFVASLTRAGFDPRFTDAAFIATTRVIPVVHRASGLPVDIVLAGPGLEQLFLDEVEHVELEEHRIPILSLENLIVTKLIAGRPKDLEDVRELVKLGRALDRTKVERVLAVVEAALGVSDLVRSFRRLR